MVNNRKYLRGNPWVMVLSTLVALIVATTPVSGPALTAWADNEKRTSQSYKQQYGHWEVVDLPEEYLMNTIHAALLPTGKVLLIAGSGNNEKNFDAYYDDGRIEVLKTGIFDPETNSMTVIPTPADLFCGGHSILQTGNLLVAGGTSGYEILEGKVTKPAGTMILHNEDPNSKTKIFPKGTKFVNESGKKYVSVQDVTVKPAEKMDHGRGQVHITHSSAKVFVEAESADPSYINENSEHYKIEGLKGKDLDNTYGQGGPMTLDKQDYRGDNISYEFNPFTKKYEEVGDLNESRWYPTLTPLTGGQVIAVSGLDNTGQITTTTETYNPATKTWTPSVNRPFPTYPAIFRTMDPDELFFSGSNAGYGPATIGRSPGVWNYKTNTFRPVEGLEDSHLLENSASVALPPAKGSNDGSQSHKIMVAGGGGIGESYLSSNRTSTIDLSSSNPKFETGTKLPEALRYLNLTVMPWDEVIASGGSVDYRARGNSYSNRTMSYDPTAKKFTQLADELIPRSYHAGSLLLPDGRVLVFGNDPLFADKENNIPSTFEQRLEIFTPPQLFKGGRPSLLGAQNQVVRRGETLAFTSTDPTAIMTARLIPPSSSTHVTNIEQRSVAAKVSFDGNKVNIELPVDENLLPNGWYMLFVTNDNGTPNKAIHIKVVK